jgi:protein-S-isoprenylcysteine O-methyltransferase Ste14
MTDTLPSIAFYLWIGLWLVWLVSALAAKRTVQRQSPGSRLAQAIPIIAAFSLLFGRRMWPLWLRRRLFPASDTELVWLGLALTAAGIAFAVWARLWIGPNWSGTVTIKEQHELIQGGPYRLVRHPIYTGFLLAFLGTALTYGEIRGLAGFLLAVLGFTLKLRTEESFMVQQFGDKYLDYKRRVKALVPFVV